MLFFHSNHQKYEKFNFILKKSSQKLNLFWVLLIIVKMRTKLNPSKEPLQMLKNVMGRIDLVQDYADEYCKTSDKIESVQGILYFYIAQ